MAKLLLRSGTIVSLDDTVGDLTCGDVLVEGERIADVARQIDCEDARVIDASGGIVLPGLINAHLHNWQVLLRGIGADWSATDYDDILHAQLAPRYTPSDLAAATLFGALSQLDTGTTTIFDWCHNSPTPDHTDAALEALEQAGIRAIFGHGTVKPDPKPRRPALFGNSAPAPRDRAIAQGAACERRPARHIGDVCARSGIRHSRRLPPEFRLAREFGLLSSAHVWGRSNRVVPDGYRTIAAEGLLGPDHNIVHGNYLEDDELDLLFDQGISVTSAPAAELRITRARAAERPCAPPRRHSLDRRRLPGVRLRPHARRLGATPCSRCVCSTTARRPGSRRTDLFRPQGKMREAITWGTIGNARALRLDHRIGSLRPGKQADIIVVRPQTMTIAPARDTVQALLNFAQNSDIETVLVGGHIVKEHGRVTHSRLEDARRRAETVAEQLFASLPSDLRERCALGPQNA